MTLLDQNNNFADNTFKSVFLKDIFSILIKICLKFIPNGMIMNQPWISLIQEMAVLKRYPNMSYCKDLQ